MKTKQLRKLIKLIRKIYAGEEYPEKFAVETGLYNSYLDELWPKDSDKLVGEWISKNIGVRALLEEKEIQEFCLKVSDEFNSLLFYANIPDKETIRERIQTMQNANELYDSICEPARYSKS